MSAITRNDTCQALGELADRLRRLRPDHRDPERFHVEKSEIEHQLRRLARQPRGSSPEGTYAGQASAAVQSAQVKTRG